MVRTHHVLAITQRIACAQGGPWPQLFPSAGVHGGRRGYAVSHGCRAPRDTTWRRQQCTIVGHEGLLAPTGALDAISAFTTAPLTLAQSRFGTAAVLPR